MEGNIIVGNSHRRSELNVRGGNVLSIGVSASNSVLERGTIHHIRNKEGVNLSGRGRCQENSNPLFGDLAGNDLHFKWSEI